MAVPGLSPLVARELKAIDDVKVTGSGFDGRSDLVFFEAGRASLGAVLSSRTPEDAFVEVGRTSRGQGDRARWVAERVWRPQRVQDALSARAQLSPHSVSRTYRVVTRVLDEKAFRRTELRDQLSEVIAASQRRWRVADPAQVEIWISEYRAGKFIAGLRLSDARMRQHHGRRAERRAALRPTVAAAMVQLAGKPGGIFLDPCCGSGTILAEARAQGWEVRGVDIDSGAVAAAARNVPGASLSAGDARRLDLAERAVAACVSNLPFGNQFTIPGDRSGWLRSVLEELVRVTAAGAAIILLAPPIPPHCLPAGLRLRERHPVRLLGLRAVIWAFERI